MHSVPAPPEQEEWAVRFNRKTDDKIRKYRECGLRFDGNEHVISYIEKNRRLLENRPQCFQHGDYHIGNMMAEGGQLRIIDFDRYDFGDPWEEFNRIGWIVYDSPHFATGLLRGYFDGEPPIDFFELLILYMAIPLLSMMSSYALESKHGYDVTMELARDILKWFDNMQNPIPTWYTP